MEDAVSMAIFGLNSSRDKRSTNKKKNGSKYFFFPSYFKKKEIYDSSSFIVRMGLQWSWPKSKSNEIYEEFHSLADIWIRYYSEYYSFLMVGGLNKSAHRVTPQISRDSMPHRRVFSLFFFLSLFNIWGCKRQSFMLLTLHHQRFIFFFFFSFHVF